MTGGGAGEGPDRGGAGEPFEGSVHVVVTVDAAHLADLAAVAAALAERGMRVERVLEAVGVVTGAVPAVRQQALTAVEGVVGVERERRFRIAPPGSAVQ